MKRWSLTAAAAAFFSLTALLSLPAVAGAKEIGGERVFPGETVVPAGETWTVKPGSTLRFRGGKLVVRGTLLVEGSSERPVRIAFDASSDGIDLRGGDRNRIANAVFSGGRRAVTVTGAKVSLRDVRFEKGGVALTVGQYGKAEVRDCSFESPERAGILVNRGGTLDVSGSRFSGARKSGVYLYGAGGASVRNCRFERNEVGLQLSMYGASATVSECVFSGNGTGILAERMAAPAVSRCEATGNRTGFRFSRRAEGSVEGCRIEENGDGVLVEYSSYPVFRRNRFRRNRDYAARLSFQSSQWEGEAGEGDRDAPAAGSELQRVG